MPSIRDALRNVVADGKITHEEWKSELQPHLDPAANKANPAARAILEVYANDQFEVDADARKELVGWLKSCGYSAGYKVPRHLDEAGRADWVARICAENITEVDPTFEKLLEATGRSGASATVAVLDGGFEVEHPAFEGKLWTNEAELAGNGLDDDGNGKVDDVFGWDFVDDDHDLDGLEANHGTHVAGIASRGTDRVKVMPLRTFSPMNAAGVIDAIEYAVKGGARVINMSFKVDFAGDVSRIREAIERHPDVLFVKTAGNDGEALGSGDFAPEIYLSANQLPNMAVIAAGYADGGRWDYTNYGAPYVTHAMVGGEVLSATPGGGYRYEDGTSMAAPQFTALAGKMLLLDDGLTPGQIKAMTSDCTWVRSIWEGRVEAGGMVEESRALQLAAMTGLIRRGEAPEAAADLLKLEGEERSQLLGFALKYAP